MSRDQVGLFVTLVVRVKQFGVAIPLFVEEDVVEGEGGRQLGLEGVEQLLSQHAGDVGLAVDLVEDLVRHLVPSSVLVGGWWYY